MKANVFFKLLPLIVSVILLPVIGESRNIDPIVSTKWLAANLNNPKLIVLDVRRVEDYREGHIPGAVNCFLRCLDISERRSFFGNTG